MNSLSILDYEFHGFVQSVEVLWQTSEREGECKGQESQVDSEYCLGRLTQTLIMLIMWVNQSKFLLLYLISFQTSTNLTCLYVCMQDFKYQLINKFFYNDNVFHKRKNI